MHLQFSVEPGGAVSFINDFRPKSHGLSLEPIEGLHLSFTVRVATPSAHLAPPKKVELTDLGLLQIWRVSQFVLAMRIRASVSFGAVAREQEWTDL